MSAKTDRTAYYRTLKPGDVVRVSPGTRFEDNIFHLMTVEHVSASGWVSFVDCEIRANPAAVNRQAYETAMVILTEAEAKAVALSNDWAAFVSRWNHWMRVPVAQCSPALDAELRGAMSVIDRVFSQLSQVETDTVESHKPDEGSDA